MFKVVALFGVGYFLSYGLRTVNAIIAPLLQQDLHLNNSQLGILSASYFVGFACLQIPVGIWLDRFGARRVESMLLLIAALGCILFAFAPNSIIAALGRGLIGVGVAACLMGPLYSFRQWYAASALPALSTTMLCIGTAGVITMTYPASYFVSQWGWRELFIVLSLALVGCATALFFGLQRNELQDRQLRAQLIGIPGAQFSWRALFLHPRFRTLALISFFSASSFGAMQTLWVGPWLMAVTQIAQPALHLLFFNALLLMTYLSLSLILQRLSAPQVKRVIQCALWLSVLASVALGATLLLPKSWHNGWSVIWWGLLFMTAASGILLQAEALLDFPKNIAGRINTTYNLVSFGGLFVLQTVFGLVIDALFLLSVSHAYALSWLSFLIAMGLLWSALAYQRLVPATRLIT